MCDCGGVQRVDVGAGMKWLEGRRVIDCAGGVSTYDGFEAAAWILKPQWFHPELTEINKKFPWLNFPHDHPPLIIDDVDITQEAFFGFPRFRNEPPRPWQALSQRELFDAMAWPFNLFDVLSGIGEGVPFDQMPASLNTEYGLGEPGASALFDILNRHSEGGETALTNVYYCTMHGIGGDRDTDERNQFDEMWEMSLAEVRSSMASHAVEEPPCNIWPLDHSWIYGDSYDLHSGIFMAGSSALIAELLSCQQLEVVVSTPETDPWRHWDESEMFNKIRHAKPLI